MSAAEQIMADAGLPPPEQDQDTPAQQILSDAAQMQPSPATAAQQILADAGLPPPEQAADTPAQQILSDAAESREQPRHGPTQLPRQMQVRPLASAVLCAPPSTKHSPCMSASAGLLSPAHRLWRLLLRAHSGRILVLSMQSVPAILEQQCHSTCRAVSLPAGLAEPFRGAAGRQQQHAQVCAKATRQQAHLERCAWGGWSAPR